MSVIRREGVAGSWGRELTGGYSRLRGGRIRQICTTNTPGRIDISIDRFLCQLGVPGNRMPVPGSWSSRRLRLMW
jgi:hypothetical protein